MAECIITASFLFNTGSFLSGMAGMRRFLTILTIFFALGATGTVSPAIGAPYSMYSVTSPQIRYTGELAAEQNSWSSQGYVQLGTDDYTDRSEGIGEAAILNYAHKLGASLVLVQTVYLGTFTETLYEEVVVGRDRIKYTEVVKGKKKTRTKTVTRTEIVPVNYTYSQYRHNEVYLVHYLDLPDSIYGMQLADLTPAIRKALKRNTGIIVTRVFENTPAYRAGFKNDDIVISINGKKMLDMGRLPDMVRLIPQNKKSTLRVIRHGIEQDVTLKP